LSFSSHRSDEVRVSCSHQPLLSHCLFNILPSGLNVSWLDIQQNGVATRADRRQSRTSGSGEWIKHRVSGE
jgi:hypothetical protein